MEIDRHREKDIFRDRKNDNADIDDAPIVDVAKVVADVVVAIVAAPTDVVVVDTGNHARLAAIVAISIVPTPKSCEERIMLLKPLSFRPQISMKIFSF